MLRSPQKLKMFWGPHNCEVYRTPYWGERKKSFGQPAVNEVNTLLKEKSQKVGMSQQEQSLVSIR